MGQGLACAFFPHHDATLCEHFLPDMTVPALRISNGSERSCVISAAVSDPVLASPVLLCEHTQAYTA